MEICPGVFPYSSSISGVWHFAREEKFSRYGRFRELHQSWKILVNLVKSWELHLLVKNGKKGKERELHFGRKILEELGFVVSTFLQEIAAILPYNVAQKFEDFVENFLLDFWVEIWYYIYRGKDRGSVPKMKGRYTYGTF